MSLSADNEPLVGHIMLNWSLTRGRQEFAGILQCMPTRHDVCLAMDRDGEMTLARQQRVARTTRRASSQAKNSLCTGW
jgi:hypothetical protein